jgi:hypothetical protein
MNFVDSAFKQLSFAWKLYNYALDGKINLEELDQPITFQESHMVLALPDKVFNNQGEMIVALENSLSVAFGAAAITLNRCREEAGLDLANPITTEQDQFASVVYQIRNAFAHDISEPRWNITQRRYARIYEFGGTSIDLRNVGNKNFEYSDIGGPDVLFWLKQYGEQNVWP